MPGFGSQRLTVPVGNVLVGNAGGHVEHDDTALAVDVVAIAQTTELLLTGRVPDIELDGAQVLFIGEYSLQETCYQAPRGQRTVVKPRGWTSTPRVAMYFFSNSPVKWRLTKVVCRAIKVSKTGRKGFEGLSRWHDATRQRGGPNGENLLDLPFRYRRHRRGPA